MDDSRLIEFQLNGKLPPERFAQLGSYVARLAFDGEEVQLSPLTEVTLTGELTQEALEEWENRYNLEYLDRVSLAYEKREALLTTNSSFKRFFQQNPTPKNSGQAQRAWDGLTSHYIRGHTERRNLRSRIMCSCPIKAHLASPARGDDGVYYHWDVVGFEPDSLYGLRDHFTSDDRTHPRLRVSPQAIATLSLYLEGLTLPRAHN